MKAPIIYKRAAKFGKTMKYILPTALVGGSLLYWNKKSKRNPNKYKYDAWKYQSPIPKYPYYRG